MKDNLIIKSYKTENIIGTKQLKDISMFFGGKMFDIEDKIIINNNTIDYSEYVDPVLKNTGYQFLSDADILLNETVYSINLFDLKNKNHTIELLQQNKTDLKFNSKWQLNINIKKILKEYIFSKIKNSRAFKCITYSDILNKDINSSIKTYIELNILNRYKFSYIEFFVKYYDIGKININSNLTLKFNPKFDMSIENENNKITNLNVIYNQNKIDNLIVNYNQLYPSTNYKFDYYFNLKFEKI